MGHLSNRNIIIAVSGGIAAYKSAELVRLLRKANANVRVLMTHGACEFITPLTLQALSGNPVHTELLDEEAEAGMGHIELARWADAVLVAPATADIIARIVQGRADDLVTAVILATPAPLFVAPAMNQQMWANQATQDNISALKQRGTVVVGPEAGEQACGDVGQGRLLEPPAIVDALAAAFDTQPLAGRKVVITAGPTREAIDPVRYLSNHSSGKMGFALARAAAEAGAQTILISGPVQLATPDRVTRVDVTSAQDMLVAAQEHSAGADLFIGAAAVADYRPAQNHEQKLKKADGVGLSLELIENPDVIATIAISASRPTVVVGFAAETQNVLEYARGKLARKNLDFIVANNVADKSIGFNSDQNAVTVINARQEFDVPVASKDVVARAIIERVSRGIVTTSPQEEI